MNEPLVSVCMPVLNGGELVVRAVESALAQDYPNVEVVVVDDGSTDGTAGGLRSAFGDRINLIRNEQRCGQGRAANHAIASARGELLKFLDHDDFLEPACVARLVGAIAAAPTAGLAFCRRRLEFAGTDAPADTGALHEGFEDLESFNAGDALLAQLVRNELRSNWIGEPSAVLVRRSAIAEVGGFSVRTRQRTDFDLWIRILARFDAVFVDEELAAYRRSSDSMSARHATSQSDWMDRVWILEALTSLPGVTKRYPELRALRRHERLVAARIAAQNVVGIGGGPPLARWFEFLGYRLRRPLSRPELVGDPVGSR